MKNPTHKATKVEHFVEYSKNPVFNDSMTFRAALAQIDSISDKKWRLPKITDLNYLNSKGLLVPNRVYWTRREKRVLFTEPGMYLYIKNTEKGNNFAWVTPVISCKNKNSSKQLSLTNDFIEKANKFTPMSRDIILSHPNILITKTADIDYVLKDGTIRKGWSIDEQVFLIENIASGSLELSKQLGRTESTLRQKLFRMLPNLLIDFRSEAGIIHWDKDVVKINSQVKESLKSSTPKVELVENKTTPPVIDNTYFRTKAVKHSKIAKTPTSDHIINNRKYDYINSENRADLIDSRIVHLTHEVDNINKAINLIRNDFYKSVNASAKKLRISIRPVKGWGLAIGKETIADFNTFQNKEDLNFDFKIGILIGFVKISFWRE